MPPRRTLAKLIRLTPDEFAEIERRARQAGLLPARFLRDAALAGSAPPPSPGATPELLHALGAIGADLRTLARAADDETIRTQAGQVLADLVAVLRQLTRDRV